MHSQADTTTPSTTWNTRVSLNNRDIVFKIDTGADVTVVPDTHYYPHMDGPLQSPQRVLTGADQQILTVQGQFKGQVSKNGMEVDHDILLSRDCGRRRSAIEALGVIPLIAPVTSTNIVAQFPTVFQGLGYMKDDYTIQLRKYATPFAITTPRRVTLPLLPKVKSELQ